MVLENAAQGNWDDVTEVERHGGKGKYRIHSDGAGEIEQTRENAEQRRHPNGTDRCHSPAADVSKVPTVRKT
jgi:hypothetical protein